MGPKTNEGGRKEDSWEDECPWTISPTVDRMFREHGDLRIEVVDGGYDIKFINPISQGDAAEDK